MLPASMSWRRRPVEPMRKYIGDGIGKGERAKARRIGEDRDPLR
jgi:hypothetical protein